MKRFFRCFVSVVFAISLACLAANAGDLKIGLVLDKGGKDDKSFNTAAYEGLMKAKSELHAKVKYVEASDDNSYAPLLRALAIRDYDLMISVGVSQTDAIEKISKLFPQKHFAIIDGVVNAPNVLSLLFEEHEGSYLVGALAAFVSKSQTLSFIGGMDIPLIRRFEMGYRAGVMKVDPQARVISNFIGITPDSWNNPAKAKELALTQYSEGSDVIFSAAGASNSGVFDAAEEAKKFAIGVDSNQNWIKPGLILTSMLKRVDVAVFDTCKNAKAGSFSAGIKRYGLANGGIDYAVDEYNSKLITPEIRNRIEALKSEIIAGKIQVPDYYKKH